MKPSLSVLPIIFVTIWAVMMETEMTTHDSLDCSASSLSTPDSCWTGWSDSPYLFYLIAAPMLVAYAVSYFIATSLNFFALFLSIINIAYFSLLKLPFRSISHFYWTLWGYLSPSCRQTALLMLHKLGKTNPIWQHHLAVSNLVPWNMLPHLSQRTASSWTFQLELSVWLPSLGGKRRGTK